MKFINKIVTICLFIIYITAVNYFTDIPLISLFFSGILFVVAFIQNAKNIKGKWYISIYTLIVLMDLLLVVYNSKYRNLPFTGVDWGNFNYFAKSVLSKSNGSIFYIITNSIDLFTALVAMLYKFFGVNIGQVYFWILPCAQVLSNYIYKTIYKLTNSEKKAKIGAILILLYPVNFIFSISVLREIPIQMLVAISIYHLIVYLKDNTKQSLVKSILAIVFACLMHSGMIGVLIVYIYILLQKKLFGNIKVINITVLLITSIIFFIICLTPVGNQITKKFDSVSSGEDLVNTMNTQNDFLEANTQYIDDVPDSVGGIILTVPYRYIMFILSPFPWQVYSFGTVIALMADGVFRYIVVYLIFKSIGNYKKSKCNNPIYMILILSIIITQLIFSFGTNNYGQAMRHRAKVLPLEIVMLVCYKKRVGDGIDEKD